MMPELVDVADCNGGDESAIVFLYCYSFVVKVLLSECDFWSSFPFTRGPSQLQISSR